MVTAKYAAFWGGRLALICGLLSASLSPNAVNADTPPAISCSEVAGQQAPSSTQAWLERSLVASHCYNFQARAVTIDALGVRTLALSHRIRNGVRQQVVQHLDGPSVSVERRSLAGNLAHFTPGNDGSVSASEAWASHVAKHYDISLQEEARVAGRDAVELRFSPLDQQRYQHTWWVDKETGLLLKHVMSDAEERVLETFQITQLHSPALYHGAIAERVTAALEPQPWRADWLPDGFVAQPPEPGQSLNDQQIYSDGLATVSVFAAPVEQPLLNEGVHQLGVSAAAVALMSEGDQRWQLIGIGELPPDILQRIVQSVTIER
ncbi:MucB/RseB C-terminal domain-containing protein [Vreelandella aquamarina]|uniref:MucB/RseB C-terminal domain-containing protein n=1 Tax=Vreelandella aquamarina TaxID=77097 RepID=UPI00384D4C99